MVVETIDNKLQPQYRALEQDLALITEELIARQDELVALYSLTEALRGCLDSKVLFDITIAELLRLLRAEGAFAIVNQLEESGRVQVAGKFAAETGALIELYQRIATSGEDLLWSGIDIPPRLHCTSLVLVPVQNETGIVAALGVANCRDGLFDYPDRKLLRVIATQLGQHLEVARLHEQALVQTRIQAELELARQVQIDLLPKRVPQISGLDIAGAARPALAVGGDFYDFIENDDSVLFMVGDVAGKGMQAAIVMSMVRTTLRNAAGFAEGITPAMILSYANTGLYDDFTEVGSFATAILGEYEVQTRSLRYANAGHSPVIYCPRNGAAQLLPPDGTALGVLPDTFSADQILTFQPGDVFVAATDGLNEARNSDGVMFGYERLLQSVERNAAQNQFSAAKIMDAILDEINQFSDKVERDDDQTVVVFKGVAQT